MGTTTLAETKIAVSAAQPASGLVGADGLEYAALSWTQDDCTLQNSPALGRTPTAVTSDLVCKKTNTDTKGTSKWDSVTFVMESDWDNLVQQILETAEGTADIISVRITYPTGNIIYFQAQVAKFSLSDGGSGNEKDKRSAELWPQMDEMVKVAAI